MRPNPRRALTLLLCTLGFLLGGAEGARASAFTVTPVRVILGQGTSSALLNVRNDSTDPIRFQISVKAWNQSASGEMQLSDTNDLVFFPALMEVKPGEQRNVRIGSSFRGPVTTERSYRIFFEELPPPAVASTDTAQRAAQVRVLTKMGVPVFIEPPKSVLKVELGTISVSKGKLEFTVTNTGNSFFMLSKADVTGLSPTGETTFHLQQDGWYVLAGGQRHYMFDLPEKCANTGKVRVELSTSLTDDKGTPVPVKDEIPLNAAACGPAVK